MMIFRNSNAVIYLFTDVFDFRQEKSIANDASIGVLAIDAHVIQGFQIVLLALFLPESFEVLLRFSPFFILGFQSKHLVRRPSFLSQNRLSPFENDRHSDARIPLQTIDDFIRSVAVDSLHGLFLRHGRLSAELLVQLKMIQLIRRQRTHMQLHTFQSSDRTEIHFHDDVQFEAFVFDLVHVFFEDALLRGDRRRFIGERRKENAMIIEHFFAQRCSTTARRRDVRTRH